MSEKCRFCENETKTIISYGDMPIANAFLYENQFKDEYYFELAPTYCPNCSLFQLLYQPNPNLLFHENYAFFANTSKYMQKHFKDLSDKLIEKFNLTKKDLIVEIGNNDGGMVRYFNDIDFNCIGIDPSKNVSDYAKSLGVNMINKFFNYELSNEILDKHGKVKCFLSANTLAHIPDINSVFKGVKNLLDDDGIYVTEDPYLIDVFDKVSYDQVYDEHVFIFSLTSISNICKKYDLEVFDIEKLNTAGGSLRYYISKKNKKKKSDRVVKQEIIEKEYKLYDNKVYDTFKSNCEKSKKNLFDNLSKLSENSKIVSYGATSKTTTIFNYCNINRDLINFITDTTPTKQNKYSPGMHIPIFDYEYFNNNLPDYCFLGAWNHSNEIFLKEKDNFSKKGKWITHTPDFNIFSK